VLHFGDLFDDDDARGDARWVKALVASASEPELIGREVVVDYADCAFVGSVDASD
jgi:hypothetical protein